MLCGEGASRMGFEIDFKCACLAFVVESDGGLDAPWSKWCRMRYCSAVVAGKAFL